MNILADINNKNHTLILLFIVSLVIFIIVSNSPVNSASGDPRWTLLVSQSLVENKTIKLDKYADIKGGYTIKNGNKLGYAIEKKDGHYYNYFPLGSSFSSVPFVWFQTQLLNYHMKTISHNNLANKQIVSIISVIIFILLYLIANMYFKSGWSIAIAFTFWLGTSLSSTLGSGLWSHTYAVLYALLSIYLMLKIILHDKNIYWIPLALSLFMAYLTRPTMSLLSVAVILYLFFNAKKFLAIKTALLTFFFLGIFMLYSLYEFDQVLPSYYMPKRLASDAIWTALMANTFSPSRGLFVFSPFLLLFILDFKDSCRIFRDNKTLIIIGGWILTHLIIISKFPHWSGGWCYGPRFMVDVLPAVYLLYLLLLLRIYSQGSSLKKILTSLFLMVTIPLSVYLNISQGLYNKYSADEWNRFPYKTAEYYFNWNYPQFLHTKKRHESRILDYYISIIETIPTRQRLYFDDDRVIYPGWVMQEKVARLSMGKKAKIFFKLKDTDALSGLLKLRVGTHESQEIRLVINGHFIGTQTVDSFLVEPIDSWDADLTFSFDPKILFKDKVNVIQFNLPDARKPTNDDPRELAIALKSFMIE